MRKGLISWIFLILSAFILYFFSNETVTLALLAVVILVLPASFFMLKYAGKRVTLSVSEISHAEDKNSFTLSINNSGWLPVAAAEVVVKCENLRLGVSDLYTVRRGLMPRKSVDACVVLSPSHVGRYKVSVSSFRIFDPLGAWRREKKCDEIRYLTFLPELCDMHVSAASSAAMPESDLLSVRSKGSVAGDMVGIREYVAGDPVRNIHWKLSEKTDKMLVKELGEPATENYLVLAGSTSEISQDAPALDAVASVFVSLMHSLQLADIAFNAAWADPSSGRTSIRRILSEEDYSDAVDSYLSVPASSADPLDEDSGDISGSRYARVIIVGSDLPENIERLTNGCEATLLMFGGTSGLSTAAVTVIGFDSKTYKEALTMVAL